MKKHILWTLCIAALSACAQKSENIITVYTAIYEEEASELEKLFREDHPEIKVNFVRESSGIIGAKLLAEKDNPQADVIHLLATSETLRFQKLGMLAPYAPTNLSNFDARFYDTNGDQPLWIGLSAWFDSFIINKVELAKRGLPMPKSYADLTNAVYSNEVVFPSPAATGTGYMIVSSFIQRLGEEKAWAYMDALHKNVKNYSLSSSSPLKTAAQGENIIGIGSDVDAYVIQEKQPDVAAAVLPSEGTAWEVELIALMKKPEVKEASKTYIEWATGSPKVLEFYKRIRAFVALKSESDKPVVKQMVNNDLVWASENKERIVKEWEKRYGGGQK